MTDAAVPLPPDPASASAPPAVKPLRVRLTAAAERAVRKDHPWVFAEGVAAMSREAVVGDLAIIYGWDDRFLAVALFDPHSPIRLRIIHRGKPVTIDTAWWTSRLEAADALRAGRIGPRTDGYRVLNGESEGCPGLVVDRYADTLVVKLYTAAWLPRWGEMEALLRARYQPAAVVLRLSRYLQPLAAATGVYEGFCGVKPASEMVIFQESGLRFESDVIQGQKTGFFLDQRENRRRVEEMAGGQDVLNAFSFSGGFSLYAARGGARRVVDLDISEHALASGRRNFALNAGLAPVAAAKHESIKADCFDWLAAESQGSGRGRFGLVIIDPPSLAKREADKESALQGYQQLLHDAARLVKPGGTLIAASCSAHLRQEEFVSLVRATVCPMVRGSEELWTSGHAVDHPATFPEAAYLKAIALRLPASTGPSGPPRAHPPQRPSASPARGRHHGPRRG
jgi:23S rRNA (cytosine1962-C5)-methyltransferase